MCLPLAAVAAASAAVQAASAIAQYNGQRTAAHQQADAIHAQLNDRDAQLQLQQDQVNQQASQQQSARAIEALQQRGRLATIFASSGLGGASQGRALADVSSQEGRDMATIEANRASQIQQGQAQRRSGNLSAGAELKAIRQPSLLGTGLQIAGSALNAYSSARGPTNKAG